MEENREKPLKLEQKGDGRSMYQLKVDQGPYKSLTEMLEMLMSVFSSTLYETIKAGRFSEDQSNTPMVGACATSKYSYISVEGISGNFEKYSHIASMRSVVDHLNRKDSPEGAVQYYIHCAEAFTYDLHADSEAGKFYQSTGQMPPNKHKFRKTCIMVMLETPTTQEVQRWFVNLAATSPENVLKRDMKTKEAEEKGLIEGSFTHVLYKPEKRTSLPVSTGSMSMYNEKDGSISPVSLE